MRTAVARPVSMDIGRCPTPRENARLKAARLLVSGRIEIVRLDEHGCLALVRGDSGEIRTVRFGRGAWTCDCPALGYCSHAIATASVVVVPAVSARTLALLLAEPLRPIYDQDDEPDDAA
jgi:hypothetical protein